MVIITLSIKSTYGTKKQASKNETNNKISKNRKENHHEQEEKLQPLPKKSNRDLIKIFQCTWEEILEEATNSITKSLL